MLRVNEKVLDFLEISLKKVKDAHLSDIAGFSLHAYFTETVGADRPANVAQENDDKYVVWASIQGTNTEQSSVSAFFRRGRGTTKGEKNYPYLSRKIGTDTDIRLNGKIEAETFVPDYASITLQVFNDQDTDVHLSVDAETGNIVHVFIDNPELAAQLDELLQTQGANKKGEYKKEGSSLYFMNPTGLGLALGWLEEKLGMQSDELARPIDLEATIRAFVSDQELPSVPGHPEIIRPRLIYKQS